MSSRAREDYSIKLLLLLLLLCDSCILILELDAADLTYGSIVTILAAVKRNEVVCVCVFNGPMPPYYAGSLSEP